MFELSDSHYLILRCEDPIPLKCAANDPSILASVLVDPQCAFAGHWRSNHEVSLVVRKRGDQCADFLTPNDFCASHLRASWQRRGGDRCLVCRVTVCEQSSLSVAVRIPLKLQQSSISGIRWKIRSRIKIVNILPHVMILASSPFSKTATARRTR